MSNIDNIHYIDIEWLDNRIEELHRESSNIQTINPSWATICTHKAFTLEELKEKSKPIKPLIEDAFDAGENYFRELGNWTRINTELNKEQYTNNLNIT